MPDATESDMESPSELSMLAWIEDAIGGKLLAYLIGYDAKALPALLSGEVELTGKQCEVVGTFSALRSSIPKEFDDLNVKEAIRNFVTQIAAGGKSVARAMREHVVGTEHLPP